MIEKIKLFYMDGFQTNLMSAEQTLSWLSMNDYNKNNIKAVEIVQTMTLKEVEISMPSLYKEIIEGD